MKLPFKAIVKLNNGDHVMPPSGILSKKITKEELEAHPEKYVHQYSNFYENAEQIKYYLSTRIDSAKEGEKLKFTASRDSKGNTFHLLTRNNKKAAAKKENPQDFYAQLLKSKKPSAPKVAVEESLQEVAVEETGQETKKETKKASKSKD